MVGAIGFGAILGTTSSRAHAAYKIVHPPTHCAYIILSAGLEEHDHDLAFLAVSDVDGVSGNVQINRSTMR